MFGNSQIGKDGSEPLLMNYANMANQFQCLSTALPCGMLPLLYRIL